MTGFELLPQELQRIIAYKITDLASVLTLEKLSSQYRIYARDIKELTTDNFREISVNLLVKFSHLQYIDHLIALNIPDDFREWSFITQLKRAHFVVDDYFVIKDLVGRLPHDGYYKISYRGDAFYGIIINQEYASALYAYNFRGYYFATIEPLLEKANFKMKKTLLPMPGVNSPKFINQALRNFLQFTDFGLVDPTLPPGETNLPLVNYTRVLGKAGFLSDILYSYLITIYKLYSGALPIVPQNPILPDMGKWLTVGEVAIYEPVQSFYFSEFETLQRIITSTLVKYSTIPIDGVFYRTDGTMSHRFRDTINH